MRKGSIVSAGLACLIVCAVAGDALAKPRYRISGAPDRDYASRGGSVRSYGGLGPYDAQPRDWLNPGGKVPVGSQNRYMVEQTYLYRDPIQKNQRSWYMGETLPRPLYNEWDPGLPVDWTPANPF